MATKFNDFMRGIEEQAEAEGPEAVAQLQTFRDHFRLGRELAQARLASGLTQKQVATKAEIINLKSRTSSAAEQTRPTTHSPESLRPSTSGSPSSIRPVASAVEARLRLQLLPPLRRFLTAPSSSNLPRALVAAEVSDSAHRDGSRSALECRPDRPQFGQAAHRLGDVLGPETPATPRRRRERATRRQPAARLTRHAFVAASRARVGHSVDDTRWASARYR